MARARAGFEFGPFRVDTATQTLTRDGVPVPLKPKAFEMLVLLLRHRERVLDKDEIVATLWPGRVVEESNLSQNVYQLRRALDDRRRPYRWIDTRSKRGYRFVGEVVEHASAPAARPAIRSLAVLPFQPLGADVDDGLRFGLADTIIAALAARGGPAVRPAGAVRAFGGPGTDVLAAARRLQVDAVVDGSVQRAGPRLRVTARLVGAADGAVLWAERFDGSLDQIFDFQDAISVRVADAIAGGAPPAASPAPRSTHVDTEAYLLLLRGRFHWHQWTPAGWSEAETALRAALARAPDYALAHAWLAATHTAQGIFAARPPAEAFALARSAARRALDADPALPEAHEFMGAVAFFADWDWPAARRWLDEAVRMNPGGAGARHLRGLLAAHVGAADEAIAMLAAARRIDPLSLIVNNDAAWVDYAARRFEAALAGCDAALRLEPKFGHARVTRGLVLNALGRHDEALAEYRIAAALPGADAGAGHYVGYGLARAGDRTGAERVLDALLATAARGETVDPMWPARLQVALDRHDEAFESFERALAARSRDLITLRVDPVWDPLRADPRHAAWLARLRLVPDAIER